MKNLALLTLSLLLVTGLAAQTALSAQSPATYLPKSRSDKAHSEAEFTALAYMRTVATAEKLYHRKHNKYADSLQTLVGSGSFTRRMVNPNRGEYTVSYHPRADGYALTLTPRLLAADHRSFYVDETGGFRVDDTQRATEKSPPLR